MPFAMSYLGEEDESTTPPSPKPELDSSNAVEPNNTPTTRAHIRNYITSMIPLHTNTSEPAIPSMTNLDIQTPAPETPLDFLTSPFQIAVLVAMPSRTQRRREVDEEPPYVEIGVVEAVVVDRSEPQQC